MNLRIININSIILLAFIILIIIPSRTFSQEEKPKRILFVGNSFTFYWNMPEMVEAMAESHGIDLDIRQSTIGGSNLKQHWLGEKGTQTRRLLDEENWDFVIFHDHSLSPLEHPERFETYAKKFDSLIRTKSAKPIFYLTWSYLSNPLMQSNINKGYFGIAEELGSDIIPVGSIWMKARGLRPDLNLYSDNKHPSADGSYLIALIIYKALTGKPLSTISNRLKTKDRDGESLYLSFVSQETASFFKQLVEESEIQPIKIEKE